MCREGLGPGRLGFLLLAASPSPGRGPEGPASLSWALNADPGFLKRPWLRTTETHRPRSRTPATQRKQGLLAGRSVFRPLPRPPAPLAGCPCLPYKYLLSIFCAPDVGTHQLKLASRLEHLNQFILQLPEINHDRVRTSESRAGLRTAALCGGLYNKHLSSLTGKTLLRQNCHCFPSYVISCQNSSAYLPFPESFQGGSSPAPRHPSSTGLVLGGLWSWATSLHPQLLTTHSASRQDHVPPGPPPRETRWASRALGGRGASPRRLAGAPNPPTYLPWEVM